MLNYLRRNLKNRRFRLEPRSRCDVLILLEREAEYLLKCVPAGATVRVCAIDRDIPIVLSPRFLATAARSLLRGERAGPAILTALIEQWDPAVILTGETIYDLPGELAVTLPSRTFIVISRCLLVPPMLPSILPIFYSYGDYDRDVLEHAGVPFQEQHSIGSLKAELIRRQTGERESGPDICFISQYRECIAESDIAVAPRGLETWFADMFNAYNAANATAFEFVHRYAVQHDLNLFVATATASANQGVQSKEKEYFRSLVGSDSRIEFIERTSTSSYDAVLGSKVAVSVDSALGFESLGLGQKVFFFVELPPMRRYLEKQFGGADPIYYAKLPAALKMTSDRFEEMETKFTALLSMGETDYKDLTASARAYYMNNSDGIPPDEHIRRRIIGVLERRSLSLPERGTSSA